METEEGVMMDTHNTESHACSKNTTIILLVISAVIIFAGGFVIGKIHQINVGTESARTENERLNKNDLEQEDNPDQGTRVSSQDTHKGSESSGSISNGTNEVVKIDIPGHILAIKDGDVWQIDANGERAVKLIDLDIIDDVSRSQLSRNIAYTLGQKVNETVEEYDGSTSDVTVTRKQLLLADEKGSDSFLIYDGVARWGWIPGEDLLWYETTSLQQFYEWGYMGNGDVWIFDPNTKKAELFISDKSKFFPLMRAEWSPDGKKLSFVSSDFLKVADRSDKVIKELFKLPYVGGDRGGPQPIPYFQWSPDSTAIYTVFTPFSLNGEGEGQQIDLQTNHVAALKIPIDGSGIERVAPEFPSQISNEETYPRAHFSDDFTKVFYPRVDSVEYPDTMQAQEDVSLVMYDLATQKETILLDDPGKTERGLLQYSTPLSWAVDKYVYVLKGDGDWLYGGATLSLIKINTETGAREVLATKEKVSENVRDIRFEPKSETIYFTADQGLVRLSSSGASVIASDVGLSQVSYYFE
jgi:hypothetical protein